MLPYFLGEQKPPGRRLASCQKCFRTTDIESVGDATHLTFFEMLGNFSVGDYFKKEAIAWAWEFFLDRMKLAPEKLWITIYLDDDESFQYWRDIGVPAEKILRFGEEDNFWGPAGSSGPCGPCSEIHFDFGEDRGCGQPGCKPNCKCGRFAEIWNLVFTQYNQDEAGQRTPLPRPNIDTGMGLERLAAVMAGKTSVYETDLFQPLLDVVAKLTGRQYGSDADDDNAMRVVVEHGRGLAFLIADGVIPGNEGRGYVLRRLLRRAALFGRRLGLDKPFLAGIADTAVRRMGHVYPELKQRRSFIKKVIELEETRFEETLNTGLEIIEGVMAVESARKKKEISGAEAFRLYDTYGFPVELTKEIVQKSGFTVDMDGFEREMEKQRERARATHKFDVAVGDTAGLKLDVEGTDFVGYHRLEQKAVIAKLLIAGEEASTISEGQAAGIILNTTPFYGEMGGQVGDTGEIVRQNGRFTVTNTVRGLNDVDVIIHEGKVAGGTLSVGDAIKAVVDMERRRDIARNHTATHLLQAALREVLGEHIQQRGSLVAPERLRFDFSHLAAMTPEEIKNVQRIVNDKIRRNVKVYDEELPYQAAVKSGAIALFDEKYGDVVRVMRIGEPVISAELCGGTHVAFTGEIGYFYILGESSIGAGLRRIEAVTGRGAESLIERRLASLDKIAQSLEASPDDVGEKVAGLAAELDKERKQVRRLEREISHRRADDLLAREETVKGIKVIASAVPSSSIEALREMSDRLRDGMKSGIVVLGSVYNDRPIFVAAVTPDLVARGYHAGDIVKKVSQVTGGGGGGKAGFAQAGGRDKGKLDEALGLVKSLI
ncbi:MAG: alanine--tRNA ligase [Chloroflexi bacterium RBG_16_60_22]|nr:MAG: alanine--tRNA ligase [Chloroflexi bacterium RBG_16_60_22]